MQPPFGAHIPTSHTRLAKIKIKKISTDTTGTNSKASVSNTESGLFMYYCNCVQTHMMWVCVWESTDSHVPQYTLRDPPALSQQAPGTSLEAHILLSLPYFFPDTLLLAESCPRVGLKSKTMLMSNRGQGCSGQREQTRAASYLFTMYFWRAGLTTKPG